MDGLMELLYTRRTYRRFEQREVSGEIVQEILEAARLSSSAANRQPLRYVVVQDKELVKKVFACTRWAGYLPKELGTPGEGEQPVLYVVVLQDTTVNANSDTDAGLAIGNMTLAAWNHGVGSCIIGSCTREVLAELFGLSEQEKIHTVVAFGYPSHKSEIVDMGKDDSIKYYLDEKKDYLVPKRSLADTVRYF